MNNQTIVQPEELKIKNIFKDTEYIIPIYQRNYAWTKIEIEQLLDDINNSNNKYYLGSLIVNRQLNSNKFEVIDGQQRLTTLFLLLSYLNDELINKNSLTFEAREKSNNTLNQIKSITDKPEIEECYSSEIIEGYKIIKQYFNNEIERIKYFLEKMNSVIIIRTQVPKNIDLNHYFEIMNTRGEQLELHEILKAKIIGAIKSENADIDKMDKIIAATIWDACAQMDKYVQMNFSIDKRKKIFGKKDWDTFCYKSFDDIRNVLCDEKNDNDTYDETSFSLIDKLKNPIKEDNNSEKNDEENERFESIITFTNFILQVNKVMDSIDSNNKTELDSDTRLDDKNFIKLLENRYSNKKAALDFIFALLKYRYLFDRYIIKREYVGKYKEEGRWSLKKLEIYIDNKKNQNPSYKPTFGLSDELDKNSESDNNKQLCLLQSCLRITYTSPKTMHWIAKVLVWVGINEEKNEKDIVCLLEQYCCNKIIESEFFSSSKKNTGFGIDRIVFTYLDYILVCRDKEKNDLKFKDFQFQYRNSIEHFFPQHNDINAVNKSNRDNFGNLALITVSANSKFSNMLPIHKIEQYGNLIEQSPKLMIMKKMVEENNRLWDDKMVIIHNNNMCDILKTEINKYFTL